MSRYFVAIVPEGLVENPALKQLVGKMKRTLSDREREVRWVAPVLWHVTLQFLGELEPRRKDDLMALLNDWNPKINELCLRLQGVGGFPASDLRRGFYGSAFRRIKLCSICKRSLERSCASGDLRPKRASTIRISRWRA